MKHLFFAFLLLASMTVSAQYDTAGVYMPAVVETVNTSGAVTPGQAHFLRKGNEVFIWGRVAITNTIAQSGTRTLFSLSLPFPIDTTIEYDAAAGLLNATQQGTHVNVSGYVYAVPSFLVVFIYNATAPGNCNTYYSYAYTAQN
jgi:hypothetical protein